jgi:hypothetical protein
MIDAFLNELSRASCIVLPNDVRANTRPPEVKTFPSGGLGSIIEDKWDKYDAHILLWQQGLLLEKSLLY